MNYDLAKELKDEGFPQGRSPWVYLVVQTRGNEPHYILGVRYGSHGYKPEEVLGSIDAPTFEELIETCGSEKLTIANTYKSIKLDHWRASNNKIHSQGSTPTEAVARLWLALNKKEV
jgi:hypothetical protein